MLLLVRHGYTRIAAFILIGVLFVLITYTNAFIFQTVRTPNTATYFALIPLAGLLVAQCNMNLFALLCMATIVVIFYLEWIGVLVSQAPERSLLDDVFAWIFTLVLNALFLNASVQRVEEKAERNVLKTVAALAIANQELQISQEQLQQARVNLETKVQQTHAGATTKQ